MAALVGATFTSCKKDDIVNTNPTLKTPSVITTPITPQVPNATGIYAAGNIATDLYGSYVRASYWKDGVAIKLSTRLSEERLLVY
ncbi:hypothetical protein [Mucilaginibacter myungsuensis]|uniref:Uncharacterized protein n=1 Tax=Mucilaginibacter myungsuensis TaxID=649104 RepID=A0A929PXM1_9SPHI|nr:hypothetical protein [Mucilaginibacter myungsuensis]MBE9663321.1 hypothetical protein [Mucilaginibacter myungsuensis]MDN3600056.1 hypothetical protein [Mucilaginibacter myungsuensis]